MSLFDRYRDRLPGRKSKEELSKHYEEVEKAGLEKGDFLAMVIAAFITFFPVLIVAMVIFFGLMWLLFIR